MERNDRRRNISVLPLNPDSEPYERASQNKIRKIKMVQEINSSKTAGNIALTIGYLQAIKKLNFTNFYKISFLIQVKIIL